MMTETKTIVIEKGLTTQDRLDKMTDAILTLRGLGLEPTGFNMDANTLWSLSYLDPTEYLDPWGGLDLKGAIEKYNFYIIGIPIEPIFNCRTIEVRRKKNDE